VREQFAITHPPDFEPAMARDAARRSLVRALAKGGIESAQIDARVLLCAALGIDHADLVRNPDCPLGPGAAAVAFFAARRLKREPVSRIIGHRDFWRARFKIGPAVLDPRHATEALIEAVLDYAARSPRENWRILDLGTGDGRLLALVKPALSTPVEAVAVDFSPAMLQAAGTRFAGDSSVTIVSHNLDHPLPALGKFDAVVSSFAIHHLVHERKRVLYGEIHELLNPGGVFCNLEHVDSPTQRLHEEFLHSIDCTLETEDPSNKLLDLETQLRWLREIGFADVDCHWKWRELALMVGRRL